jgi:5-formyltetrahydrofolate cyclo-ligase
MVVRKSILLQKYRRTSYFTSLSLLASSSATAAAAAATFSVNFAFQQQSLRSPTLLLSQNHIQSSFRIMSTNDNHETIRKEKQLLRKEIRAALKSLSPEEIQRQSHAVWNRLHALSEYKNAQSIGLFLSMPTAEINTDLALQQAVLDGKEIYVPCVGKDFEKANMELIHVKTNTGQQEDGKLFHHSWPKNKWDIPEPPPEAILGIAQPGDIDLLVVPGLAFCRGGSRLGQGKGYYDRFISRMVANTEKPPKLVAVGLSCQLVDESKIPMHEHDHPVQFVIVPDETIQIED